LRFSLTAGIAEGALVRLENSLNHWRDLAYRSAVAGRA
jgi:hypothetical protein